jgi:hypothetical protein
MNETNGGYRPTRLLTVQSNYYTRVAGPETEVDEQGEHIEQNDFMGRRLGKLFK